ncbi:MAG: hypothetical protein PHV93_00880 [Candidatus Pacebacteria bacterium]|nr:hypothetical protein [Candidatus Paceibacterota bacterium]
MFVAVMALFPALMWGAEAPKIELAPERVPDLTESERPKPPETEKKESRLSFSLKTSLLSEYTTAVGVTLTKAPIGVVDFSAAYQTNLGSVYVGTWNSVELDLKGHYGENFADEIDFYAGWVNTWKGWVKTNVTVSEFNLEGPNGGVKRIDNDLFAADLKVDMVGMKIKQFVPYVKIREFEPLGSKAPEGGWFSWVGFSGSQNTGLSLNSKPISFNYDISYAHSWGAVGRNPGPAFVQGNFCLPIPVLDRMSITPNLRYVQPIGTQFGNPGDFADKRRPRVIPGIEFGWKF